MSNLMQWAWDIEANILNSFNINPYLVSTTSLDQYTVSSTSIAISNNPVNTETNASFGHYKLMPKIKKVIFNPPATIVYWTDGSKTVVKTYKDDFSEEHGLAMAISRKYLCNNRSEFKRIVKNASRQEPNSDEFIPCIYWGIFFNDSDLNLVHRRGKLEKNLVFKHVTFEYNKPFPAKLLGKKATVAVVGYGCSEDNEAIKVEFKNLEDSNRYKGANPPHITLSVSETGFPKNSVNLEFKPEKHPYTLTGRYGYFGHDGIMHIRG